MEEGEGEMVCARRPAFGSVIERAGIHHRGDFAFAAKNDQEVAYHCRLPFFVQLHDAFV